MVRARGAAGTSPSVARELAPLGAEPTAVDGRSAAEALLRNLGPDTGTRRITELRMQAWWAEMWRAPESPYRIVSLDEKQEELVDRLLLAIDRRCFPTTEPGDIEQHPDARIVCESVVLGAKMLLTSNLRSIDRVAPYLPARRTAGQGAEDGAGRRCAHRRTTRRLTRAPAQGWSRTAAGTDAPSISVALWA